MAQSGRLTRPGVAGLRSRRVIIGLLALTVASVALTLIATASAGAAWKPGPERYTVGEQQNVPVRMRDGTVLRANVFYPTDPSTGEAANGPFPALIVQTPYGKDAVGTFSGRKGGAEAATEAGPLPYFVKRGYIDVVAEVRGTGDSHPRR